MDTLSWSAVLKSLVFWGPGAILALSIIYALFKLATGVGLKIAEALTAQANAQTAQATSMEGLKAAITTFVMRDSGEHREMLVLLKYIAQHQQEMDEVRREHAEMKLSQEGGLCPGR